MFAAGLNLYQVYGVSGGLLAIVAVAALIVVFGLVIATRRARLRRRKLRAFDPCQHCGFDLRATIGPCPECGATRPKPPPGKHHNDLFDDFEEPRQVS